MPSPSGCAHSGQGECDETELALLKDEASLVNRLWGIAGKPTSAAAL